MSYPGKPGDDGDQSPTLKGKAEKKVEKYKALMEELRRRHGPAVSVDFYPLVFASIGAVPTATVHAVDKLVHEEGSLAGCGVQSLCVQHSEVRELHVESARPDDL